MSAPTSHAVRRPVSRVGILGFGHIGSEIHRRIVERGSELGLEVAFVWTRDARRLEPVPAAHRLGSLTATSIAEAAPDLVVEAASPEVITALGADILRTADLLPLSVTALVDDELRERLSGVAAKHGTRWLIPHGALVGAAALADVGDRWSRVTFRMTKPPSSIDPAAAGLDAAALGRRTVIHDGSVRSAAVRFPRNVNAMVAGALLSVGLDRARAVLVADPERRDLELSVEAVGTDGSQLRVVRRQPAAGVSGTEMGAAAWSSVLAATGHQTTGGLT